MWKYTPLVKPTRASTYFSIIRVFGTTEAIALTLVTVDQSI